MIAIARIKAEAIAVVRSALERRGSWRDALKQRAAKEFLWIVLGQVVATAGGFVGFRLLSEHLTTAIWGQVLVWQTVALLINKVIVGGLAAAALRFAGVAYREGQLKDLLGTVFSMMVIAVLGLLLVLLALVATDWLPILRSEWRLLVLVVILAIINGLCGIADAVQSSLRHRAVVAFHQSMAQCSRFAFAIVAVLVAGPDSTIVFVGFVVGAALILLSEVCFGMRLVALQQRELPPRAAGLPGWRGPVLRYAWPFGAWGILNWLQSSTERWSIEANIGAESLGIYGAASQLSTQPITMLWGAILQLLSPIIFRVVDVDRDYRRANRMVAVAAAAIMGVGLLSGLVVATLGKYVVFLFVGPRFHGITHYWPALFCIAGLAGTGQVLSVHLMARRKSDRLIIPRVATSATGVAALLVLVPRWGIDGAIVAAGLSALVSVGTNLAMILNHDDSRADPLRA